MAAIRRVLAQSVAAATAAYVVSALLEAVLIRSLRPTEFELEWVSDLVLAAAFGGAVYLWRHLAMTRQALAEHERRDLVLRTQLSVAAEIQQRLLPALPPRDRGLDCAAALQSAGMIGGDFYDFVEAAPGVWVILVADVSGKGVPAAMALGSLRSTFRALARQRLAPSETVKQLSAAFLEEWRGTLYVTCIVAVVDVRGGTVTYTNAGHPQAVLLRAGDPIWLGAGGPPAGLLPHTSFDEELVPVRDGDTCVFVTDGVTEALDGPSMLDETIVAASRASDVGVICAAVMTRAMTGPGPAGDPSWDDDRTVVVVAIHPRDARRVAPSSWATELSAQST